MTVAAGHVTPGRTAPGLPPADASEAVEVPRLADGVELLGEYQDSGYSQPPSLVRRRRRPGHPDVAAAVPGCLPDRRLPRPGRHRGPGQRRPRPVPERRPGPLPHHRQAAAPRHRRRRGRPGRPAEGQPAARAQGAGHAAARAAANAAGTLLRPLFRWPVVAAVVASVAAVDYWLFAAHGLGAGVQQVLRDPVDLLIVLGLSVVSAVFHECGHAAGCRYGGARPGVIGVGIYLVWPSFFTNVTDSYRLSRAGRLRTDLGGLYFNLIFMLALAGIYAATSDQVLLLVIALTHLEMLEQLLPFVRFDGYFILSDLVGVPDLFARIAPVLRSALPAGRRDPRVTGLRRRTRIVVTGWVLCVIPLLTFTLGYLLLHLPKVNRALWRSASLAGPPHVHRGRRPPLRDGRGRRHRRRLADPVARRLAVHRDRAGPAAHRRGPALVRRPSRPPPPGHRSRPGVHDSARHLLDRARPVPRLVAHRHIALLGLPGRHSPGPPTGTSPRRSAPASCPLTRCTTWPGRSPAASTWPPRPGRRGRLACIALLAAFWTMQGQFRGW